uniref:Uncharacterized protein n=1 Tax=Trichobilharzia regenti TaxID=157069 RepID=A0AA85KCX6_TRIRE|nr:unnamed protein product [Trichobilharzia regenti]
MNGIKSLSKILSEITVKITIKTECQEALEHFNFSQINYTEDDLDRNALQRQTAIDSLPDELRSVFMNYILDVIDKRMKKHCVHLIKILNRQLPQNLFSKPLGRYVHNFPSISLTLLELEFVSLSSKFSDIVSLSVRLETE